MHPRSHRLLLPLLLAVVLAGCAYGRHIDRGDEAFAQGQYAAALAEYQAALKLEPDSEEATAKVAVAREKVVEQSARIARQKLADGDFLGAVEAAAECHQHLPENEGVRAVVREVSQGTQQSAAALVDAGRFAAALGLYESLLSRLPPERTAVEPKAAEVRARWAERLAAEGSDAAQAGRKAEALLRYSKAAQLVADPAAAERRDALRAEYLQNLRYVVRPSGNMHDQGFLAVASALEAASLPQGVKVVGAAEPRGRVDASVRVALSMPSFQTHQTTRPESAAYQSGTRMVENPFYKTKQDHLADEERRLVGYENDVTQLENDVTRYQSDVAREGPSPNVSTMSEQSLANAESQLTSARSRVVDQRNALQRARDELQNEPMYREEPVYSSIYYTVTTYTLTGVSTLETVIGHPDGRPAVSVARQLAAQATDDEHAEQPVAGVPADPLELPPPQDLVRELHAQAAQQVTAAVMESFVGYRRALLERASSATSDRLDLLALYALSDPNDIDPSAAGELQNLSGIPDALELLRAE